MIYEIMILGYCLRKCCMNFRDAVTFHPRSDVLSIVASVKIAEIIDRSLFVRSNSSRLYLLFALSGHSSWQGGLRSVLLWRNTRKQKRKRERERKGKENVSLVVSSERSRQCATGVLLPLGSLPSPSWPFNENGLPLLALWRRREKQRREERQPPSVAAWLSPWANDRVISANQIGDCLTPEQQRDRQEAEGDAPRTNLLSRRTLICISKSNARAVGIVPISSLTGTYSLRNTLLILSPIQRTSHSR